MLKVGVTGGIGAGKSTLCKAIETLGYPVFYSDKVAKELISTNSEVQKKIIALIGEDAYTDGIPNTSYIAKKIFNNSSLKEQVNQLIHPLVRNSFNEWASLQDERLVFNEAAILFETGSYKQFDYTILVVADKKSRIKRIQKRDNTTEDEINQRMQNQWTDEEKIKLADFVIDNSDDKLLVPQLLEVVNALKNNPVIG